MRQVFTVCTPLYAHPERGGGGEVTQEREFSETWQALMKGKAEKNGGDSPLSHYATSGNEETMLQLLLSPEEAH